MIKEDDSNNYLLKIKFTYLFYNNVILRNDKI